MIVHLFLGFKRLAISQFLIGLSCLSFFAWPPVGMATSSSVVAPATILIYGDSLSAAYGISTQQGWVTLLQKKLEAEHYQYRIVNASISGETTSGGLSRLASKLAETQPAIVLLELGGNDGLRGLPIREMHHNLDQMIKLSQKAGAKVLLIGMQIPPNYGLNYAKSFSQTYSDLSQAHNIKLLPFLLEKIATQPQFTLEDGLHPNSLAQPLLVNTIWPYLKSLLKK